MDRLLGELPALQPQRLIQTPQCGQLHTQNLQSTLLQLLSSTDLRAMPGTAPHDTSTVAPAQLLAALGALLGPLQATPATPSTNNADASQLTVPSPASRNVTGTPASPAALPVWSTDGTGARTEQPPVTATPASAQPEHPWQSPIPSSASTTSQGGRLARLLGTTLLASSPLLDPSPSPSPSQPVTSPCNTACPTMLPVTPAAASNISATPFSTASPACRQAPLMSMVCRWPVRRLLDNERDGADGVACDGSSNSSRGGGGGGGGGSGDCDLNRGSGVAAAAGAAPPLPSRLPSAIAAAAAGVSGVMDVYDTPLHGSSAVPVDGEQAQVALEPTLEEAQLLLSAAESVRGMATTTAAAAVTAEAEALPAALAAPSQKRQAASVCGTAAATASVARQPCADTAAVPDRTELTDCYNVRPIQPCWNTPQPFGHEAQRRTGQSPLLASTTVVDTTAAATADVTGRPGQHAVPLPVPDLGAAEPPCSAAPAAAAVSVAPSQGHADAAAAAVAPAGGDGRGGGTHTWSSAAVEAESTVSDAAAGSSGGGGAGLGLGLGAVHDDEKDAFASRSVSGLDDGDGDEVHGGSGGGADDDDESRSDLPGPMVVAVYLPGTGGLAAKRGVFDPARYMRRRECIQMSVRSASVWVSRSRFERLCGCSTAKWYRSIRVLGPAGPDGDLLASSTAPPTPTDAAQPGHQQPQAQPQQYQDQHQRGASGGPHPVQASIPCRNRSGSDPLESLGEWLLRHGLPVWKGPNRLGAPGNSKPQANRRNAAGGGRHGGSGGGGGGGSGMSSKHAPRATLGAAAAAAVAALMAAEEAARAPAGSSLCASAAASAVAAAAAATAAAARAAAAADGAGDGEAGGTADVVPLAVTATAVSGFEGGITALEAALRAAGFASAAVTAPATIAIPAIAPCAEVLETPVEAAARCHTAAGQEAKDVCGTPAHEGGDRQAAVPCAGSTGGSGSARGSDSLLPPPSPLRPATGPVPAAVGGGDAAATVEALSGMCSSSSSSSQQRDGRSDGGCAARPAPVLAAAPAADVTEAQSGKRPRRELTPTPAPTPMPMLPAGAAVPAGACVGAETPASDLTPDAVATTGAAAAVAGDEGGTPSPKRQRVRVDTAATPGSMEVDVTSGINSLGQEDAVAAVTTGLAAAATTVAVPTGPAPPPPPPSPPSPQLRKLVRIPLYEPHPGGVIAWRPAPIIMTRPVVPPPASIVRHAPPPPPSPPHGTSAHLAAASAAPPAAAATRPRRFLAARRQPVPPTVLVAGPYGRPGRVVSMPPPPRGAAAAARGHASLRRSSRTRVLPAHLRASGYILDDETQGQANGARKVEPYSAAPHAHHRTLRPRAAVARAGEESARPADQATPLEDEEYEMEVEMEAEVEERAAAAALEPRSSVSKPGDHGVAGKRPRMPPSPADGIGAVGGSEGSPSQGAPAGETAVAAAANEGQGAAATTVAAASAATAAVAAAVAAAADPGQADGAVKEVVGVSAAAGSSDGCGAVPIAAPRAMGFGGPVRRQDMPRRYYVPYHPYASWRTAVPPAQQTAPDSRIPLRAWPGGRAAAAAAPAPAREGAGGGGGGGYAYGPAPQMLVRVRAPVVRAYYDLPYTELY